jgi:CRISPR-associated protein (TIGR03986 family)
MAKKKRQTKHGSTLPKQKAQHQPRTESPGGNLKGFINPYNFVRFMPDVCRGQPRTHEKFAGLSGRITVELTVITPLCIPDPEATASFEIEQGKHEDKQRLKKPFCNVGGKPYIPGSSLKGMLRNVAEAASNSCFSILTSELAVFRDNRENAIKYRRLGRLVKANEGDWVVQDIHPDSGRPPASPQNPVDIWNNRKRLYRDRASDLFPDPQRYEPAPADVEESFQSGGQHFRWYDFLRGVFGDTERRDYDTNGRSLVERRGRRVTQDRRPKDPKRQAGEPAIIRWPVAEERTSPEYSLRAETLELYERMVKSDAFRRFHGESVQLENWQEKYLTAEEDQIYWFRLRLDSDEVGEFGRNFRYKWAYDPRQALPESLHPCEKPHELCPCCGLFGMVEQREGETGTGQEPQVNALASKVAVGPAHWIRAGEPTFCWINDHKILSTPKFSCRSFYLGPSDGAGARHASLQPYKQSNDVSGAEFVYLDAAGRVRPTPLRGRKFYWHHTTMKVNWHDPHQVQQYVNRLPLPDGQPPHETDQNAKIQTLLPDDARFSLDIEFENLRDWELGLLLWTIELPDMPQGAHHLGLGKPIGLGSVRLKITRIEMINRQTRYKQMFATGAMLHEPVDLTAPPFGDYVAAFRDAMKRRNNGEFDALPNIQDLKVILSTGQPACAKSGEVPIIYPPGNPNARVDREQGDPNPMELHHQWFGQGVKWAEPLVPIQYIAKGEYQTPGKYR